MALTGMDYALRLLTRRRYSTRELEEKLRKKGFEDISSIVKRLKEWKYLNDEDFAQNFIATKSRLNPRGKTLLQMELRAKNIPLDIIQKVLAESDISEFELAQQIVRKKLPFLKKYPMEKRRERIFSLLKRRGFQQDIIYRIFEKLNSLLNNR